MDLSLLLSSAFRKCLVSYTSLKQVFGYIFSCPVILTNFWNVAWHDFPVRYTIGISFHFKVICHHISGIDPGALRTVINYIYTHDKTLFTEDNMAEVMQLADFLQCKAIIDLCLDIIWKTPTVETVPLYVRYSTPASKQMVFYEGEYVSGPRIYLKNHYIDIIHHPDFVGNTVDAEDLSIFIDPIFPIKKEWHILIFQVIVRWLKFSESRKVHADQLLRKVCYGYIRETDIRDLVLPSMIEFPRCKDLISLLRSYTEKPYEQPFLVSKFMSVEERMCDEKFLRQAFHVFGMHDSRIDTDMMGFCLDLSGNSFIDWRYVSKSKVMEPRGDVIGNYAFVVGGYIKDPESGIKIPSDRCIRFNMTTGEDAGLAPLPQASFWNAAVIHQQEHQLWVLGGVVKRGHKCQLSASVQIYDIKTNKWKSGPSLPEPLSQLAACYSKLPVGIFISGGITQNVDEHGKPVKSNFRVVRSAIYFISSDTEDWEQMGSLQIPRYGHAMYMNVIHDPSVLYVIGGKNLQAQYVENAECISEKVNGCFKIPGLQGSISFHDKELISITDTPGVMQIRSLPKDLYSDNILLDQRMTPMSLKDTLILSNKREIDVESKDPMLMKTNLPSVVDVNHYMQLYGN